MPYTDDGVWMPVALRAPYSYDADAVSRETGVDMTGVADMAQQQFKDEADINTIVKRFGLTGELPENVRLPVSGDFTGIGDFQSAMNAVRAAEESFMQVPAHIRARFGNDPAALIDFLGDDKNRDEALKLGLLRPPPEVTRDAVAAIDDLASKLVPKA